MDAFLYYDVMRIAESIEAPEGQLEALLERDDFTPTERRILANAFDRLEDAKAGLIIACLDFIKRSKPQPAAA